MSERTKKEIIKDLNSDDFMIENVFRTDNEVKEPAGDRVNAIRDELLSKLDSSREFYNGKIDELRVKLKTPSEYNDIEIQLHGLRQKILDEKYSLQNMKIKNEYKIKKAKRLAYENARTKSNLKLKTKSDTDLYVDTSEMVMIYSMVDATIRNFLEWASETARSIDNLRWSVKTQFDIKKWLSGE